MKTQAALNSGDAEAALPAALPGSFSEASSTAAPSFCLTPDSPPANYAQPRKPKTEAARAHARKGNYARRQRRREAESRKPKDPAAMKIRSSTSKRAIGLVSKQALFSLTDLSWAKGAFIGRRQPDATSVPTLDEIRDEGFEILEWDGWYVHLNLYLSH